MKSTIKKISSYEEFEKAIDTLQIASKITSEELKRKYQMLSKKYHPDMPDGDAQKFRELNEAYKLIQTYIKNYRFSLDEDEFYNQNPFLKKSSDWFYSY